MGHDGRINNAVRIWRPTPPAVSGVATSFSMTQTVSLPPPRHVSEIYSDIPDVPLVRPGSPGGNSLLRLAPNARQYLLGLLVETEPDGVPALGITHYLTAGHKGIAHCMTATLGPVRRFLWGGELCFVNPADREAIGILQAVNETCGFLHEQFHGVMSRRPDLLATDIAHVVAYVRRASPFAVAETLDVVPYNPDHQHLCERLEALGPAKINVRHTIGNILQGASQPMTFIQRGASAATIQSVVAGEVIHRDIATTEQLCVLLSEYGLGDTKVWQRFAMGLRALLAGAQLSPERYRAIAADYDILEAFYFQHMVRDEGNVYELVVL